MEQRTSGLVLRTRPLTETSLIVHWLTLDFGRLSTVAKGARRSKSPFAGKLDLFFLADFTFQQSRRSELHNLREVSVRDHHSALRHHLGYLQQACYFTQLLELMTEVSTPLPGLLELALQCLEVIPLSTPAPRTVFAFELKLLAQLGLKPDLSESGLSAGVQAIADRLETVDWPVLSRFELTSAQTAELARFLSAFWLYHFGKVPKGRASALDAS